MMAVDVPLPSPPKGVALAGFLPVRYWDGTGGGLSASFLKIEREDGSKLVIVAVDTLFLDDEFQARLQGRLDPGVSLVLVASHTHFAPALAKSMKTLGGVNDGYYEAVLDCIAHAILNGSGPVLSEMGHFVTPTNLTVNRRREGFMIDYSAMRRGQLNFSKGVSLAKNPVGIVDQDLRVVSFCDAGGKPVACIWSLAAHAAFSDDYCAISPDFPGRVRAFLKAGFGPEFVSIFVPGLAGSAIPDSTPKRIGMMTNKERLLELLPFHHAIQPLDPDGYEDWSRQVGELIAKPMLSLAYDPINGMKAHHDTWRSQPIFEAKEGEGICLDLNLVRVGREVEIVTSNGELLGEWKPLLDWLPAKNGLRIISGYAAGACLYVPPANEIRHGGYEVNRFREAFGLKGEFVEAIDRRVVAAFEQLLVLS